MTVAVFRGLSRCFGHLVGLVSGRSRYDYREHWVTFTRRLSTLRQDDEIAREVASTVMRAAGPAPIAVFLVDAEETGYRLSAGVGAADFVSRIDRAAAVPFWLNAAVSWVRLPADALPSLAMPPLPAALGVPIRWRTALVGFIVLGPRSAGTDYTPEDMEFVATIAAQAAPSIMTIRRPAVKVQPRTIETVDRCTAAVIHDLKNSVSALSLLTRNAVDHFADPDFQHDAIITLSRTVERMQRSLVKLSSPAAPTTLARTEPIDLQGLIIEATTPLATDTKIRLVRELHPVNTVYGDRDALLRVVENLTTNAAEAIDHEGTVTVTLAEEQGHAVISVADTGCGISEEYQGRHLFSPFRSTKNGGWGLGLYQTKQAVENQSGEILVESVEGHGTTFTVRLPLRADAEDPSLESVR
jgi:putative PEP-CTERM system histidine kinase